MHAVMTSLKEYEPKIHQHLLSQSMKPEFFAFRWITLLLSQEFQLPGMFRRQIFNIIMRLLYYLELSNLV